MGLCSLRLGMAFASKEIVDIFNKVKYPYNVNLLYSGACAGSDEESAEG